MRMPLAPAGERAGGWISAGMISTVQTPLPILALTVPKVWPAFWAPSPESLTISTMCSGIRVAEGPLLSIDGIGALVLMCTTPTRRGRIFDPEIVKRNFPRVRLRNMRSELRANVKGVFSRRRDEASACAAPGDGFPAGDHRLMARRNTPHSIRETVLLARPRKDSRKSHAPPVSRYARVPGNTANTVRDITVVPRTITVVSCASLSP